MKVSIVHFFVLRSSFTNAGDYCLKIDDSVFFGDMKDCLNKLRKQFDDHDKISLRFKPPEGLKDATPLTPVEGQQVLERIWADRLVLMPERKNPVLCGSARFRQPGISS